MARFNHIKCKTKFCRNVVKRSGFCSTCRSKKCREKNRMRYAYVTLRNNAKRRNIVFEISFEYFKRFCYRTKYIQNKGITHDSYSIDRIKNNLGYIERNIRCLTVSQNSKKGTKILSYDWRNKTAIYY